MRQSARFDESPYTRFRRLRRVFWFFSEIIEKWPAEFERTQSKHIARTYGLSVETVKQIKSRFRNELSFGAADGK